jgi:hypothetical protein
MGRASDGAARFPTPPPQKNLDRATELGFAALAGQSDEQMRWLGATPVAERWEVVVLNDRLQVDRGARRVTTSLGQEVGPHWRILVLHYLAITERPESRVPKVTFADLPTARSYNSVYQGRTVGRLCATVGREAKGLRAAALTLGGQEVEGGDEAFQFDVFPRLSLGLVWFASDEEFSSSATILLPANIESYFCAEDIVVLSERLVSRLCGRPF